MNVSRKIMTLSILVVTLTAVWWLAGLGGQSIKTDSPVNVAVPAIIDDSEATPGNLELEEYAAFFVEYRLQRDRVRGKELEMLNGMIGNPDISQEGKKQAEAQLLALVETMEKELLVENMLKAHGFADAVFFYRGRMTNVVVQAENLKDQEFLQIAEMVSGVTGVEMEEVTVVEHSGP
ncbi:MAG: SpoIIIAH-like family protein [Dethiobacter sp.]|jgi:stage III sporulation protein AH|nr:SpoIIIAH-like family protein [Dethiobacter sp.]MCL4464069.1 SpoIIIAH-like family protein [Bacillota bacterium]MCL5993084.1 SpoIIIAH-like family protein [Bacillota bacterium]